MELSIATPTLGQPQRSAPRFLVAVVTVLWLLSAIAMAPAEPPEAAALPAAVDAGVDYVSAAL